jgi:hypothetical protein
MYESIHWVEIIIFHYSDFPLYVSCQTMYFFSKTFLMYQVYYNTSFTFLTTETERSTIREKKMSSERFIRSYCLCCCSSVVKNNYLHSMYRFIHEQLYNKLCWWSRNHSFQSYFWKLFIQLKEVNKCLYSAVRI